MCINQDICLKKKKQFSCFNVCVKSRKAVQGGSDSAVRAVAVVVLCVSCSNS